MKDNETISELISCEKFIVDFQDRLYNNFGYERMIEKRGWKKSYLLIISSLFHLKKLGYLILYCILCSRKKKYSFKVFNNNIVFSDHKNEVIQNNIINKNDIALQSFHCPYFIFVKPLCISRALKSYSRSTPNSITAFNELCNFWIYYTLFSYCLPRLKFSGVLTVDDFSAKRIALVLAAKENGMKVGIVKITDQLSRLCPFRSFHVLFCWNYQQSSEAEDKYRIVNHLQRSSYPYKKLILGNSKKYIVGIALNAFFNDEGLEKLVTMLNSNENIKNIVIRFHPSTNHYKYIKKLKNENFEISDNTPELFLKDIDIMISGSTSFIKEALLRGVPVAYEEVLDSGKKDAYSYVANGMIYNMSGSHFDDSVIEEINQFYMKKEWKELRAQWISHDPRAVTISDALDYLSRV